MTTKVVRIFYQSVLSLLLFISLYSCERDIDEVGVNIVDNNVFKTDKYTSDVTAYNQNILKRKANRLNQYLLGVYKNNDFGQIDASIISQMTFNTTIDFGLNPSIDTIIVNIPYITYLDSVNNALKLMLDGIGIDQDTIINTTPFNLNIYQLETYLNTLDPLDPSQALDYYTDEDFSFSTLFYSGEFSPNENDTILIVERPEIIIDEEQGIYNKDTILSANSAPSIKIPLDKEYFTNNFLNNPAIFQNLATFIEFFKGLYLEASVATDGPEASVLTLNLLNATMSIYYTNTVDGVRTKQVANFLFGGQTTANGLTNGITINKYTRDYSGSNAESIIPDPIAGDEQLFLQGAAGSIALIDLFTNDDIEELRSNNWLINNASLIFYIDQTANQSIVPDRLFVYNYDENRQLPDMIIEGPVVFGGFLEYDDNDNPYRYKVNITDYISRVLAINTPIDASKLAVNVFNLSDLPTGLLDLEIKDYNWNPKGIIVHGNQSSDIEKRIKLEITYSEINQ